MGPAEARTTSGAPGPAVAPGTVAGPAGRAVGVRRPGTGRRLLLLGAVVVAAMVLGLGLGAVRLPPEEVVGILAYRWGLAVRGEWPAAHETIILELRLPRVVLGALVGGALGIAGATFQGLFRNPMADPYVIGVSSGAAVGAVATMALRLRLPELGIGWVPPMAFVGALGAVLLVYNLARVNGRVPVMALLLAGVAVAALLSAVVSLMIYFTADRVGHIVFWLMGGLSGANWRTAGLLLPYVLGGAAALSLYARDLNAMLLGEEPALHLGVPVEGVKRVLLLVGSLLTAAAVAVSGIIGFVGLVVPHAVRLVAGPDHRFLLPASALVGGAFLVLADALARTLLAPTELPVGILTALAGGPFFLYLLRRRRMQL